MWCLPGEKHGTRGCLCHCLTHCPPRQRYNACYNSNQRGAPSIWAKFVVTDHFGVGSRNDRSRSYVGYKYGVDTFETLISSSTSSSTAMVATVKCALAKAVWATREGVNFKVKVWKKAECLRVCLGCESPISTHHLGVGLCQRQGRWKLRNLQCYNGCDVPAPYALEAVSSWCRSRAALL